MGAGAARQYGMRGRTQRYEIVLGLYQGGAISPGTSFRDLGVSAVVDLETVAHYVPAPPIGGVYVHWPIPDGHEIDPSTTRAVANCVKGLMEAGHVVLVHCSAGLNRSSLVTARTLIAMGWEPHEAVAHVRRCRRHPGTLGNRSFETWLYGETPGT